MEQTAGENTNNIALDIFNRIGVKVNASHLDRSHRLKRRPQRGRNRPAPIIVKFTSHDVKDAVYQKRDLLRRSREFRGIYINENVTGYRKGLYREVRSLHSLGWSSWTRDGAILLCRGQHTHTAPMYTKSQTIVNITKSLKTLADRKIVLTRLLFAPISFLFVFYSCIFIGTLFESLVLIVVD